MDASDNRSYFTIFDQHLMNYGMVQINFQLCSFKFTQFVPHGLTCSDHELCCANIKRHIFWKLRGLGISNMSSLITDVTVCIWYNDKFLQKGAAKFKPKKFSEFGSQTVT